MRWDKFSLHTANSKKERMSGERSYNLCIERARGVLFNASSDYQFVGKTNTAPPYSTFFIRFFSSFLQCIFRHMYACYGSRHTRNDANAIGAREKREREKKERNIPAQSCGKENMERRRARVNVRAHSCRCTQGSSRLHMWRWKERMRE